jgi:hypothetical protein
MTRHDAFVLPPLPRAGEGWGEGAAHANTLTCSARSGKHAAAARRARRMRLETPVSPPTLSRTREREFGVQRVNPWQ